MKKKQGKSEAGAGARAQEVEVERRRRRTAVSRINMNRKQDNCNYFFSLLFVFPRRGGEEASGMNTEVGAIMTYLATCDGVREKCRKELGAFDFPRCA